MKVRFLPAAVIEFIKELAYYSKARPREEDDELCRPRHDLQTGRVASASEPPSCRRDCKNQGLRSPEKRTIAHGDRENAGPEPLRA